MLRILCLMILGFLISSCAMNAQNNYGAIDLKELNNNKDQYGIAVFRSIYFSEQENLEKFVQNENSIKLNYYDEADVFAKQVSGKLYGVFYFGYEIGGAWSGSDTEKEKRAKFTVTPEVRTFASVTLATVKPEYFYTVTMLPVGDYYVSRIAFGYDTIYDEEDSPYNFSINAGQINYLGDLYFSSPTRNDDGFFSSRTYSISTTLLNESEKAKVFLSNFYPELKLPFVTNLIKRSTH